ncbi:hypothetical protein TSACC_22328 [Terrimicrobium sacchariphilum]|uniref:Response regulatory domain-containing protein n=1 Tax=Terrimicrobium sacchariphilum TaxID=690879 RepID=A0A146GAT8_TERSA|nr:hypothetical protein [Terrimicrobium sacchariphilum]GAT33907.1 hypothetical protein TSACC_22328 [Terrimicrobium sacchariphilum]
METTTFLPRIALFVRDGEILGQIERILRDHYSSLLVISEREKLQEIDSPIIVITDSIQEVALIRDIPPVDGTEILVVARDDDNEMLSAAFDSGATDYLAYPFAEAEVITKTEKYLTPFRDE